ncbi:MAG: motility protein A [Pirellulales bacterium]
MDIASILGLLLAMIFMAVSVVMGGGSAGAFLDPASIIVTIGGCFATVMAMFPLKMMFQLPKAFIKVIKNKPPNTDELVKQLIGLSEMARREGLVALDRKLGEIQDTFLVLGLQMAVDGTQPEVISSVLQTEMEALNGRNKDFKGLFDQFGKMGPAFGMIGTLMGLIMMLGNLSDPDALGPGMAVAMITTLYGAVIANVICIPCSEKLNYVNRMELQAMDIVMRGVLSIRDGESPRALEQKLGAFTSKKPQKEAA